MLRVFGCRKKSKRGTVMAEYKLAYLQREIDACREKLNSMSIDDPEIIKVSGQLDILLNEYIRLKSSSDS